MIYTVALDFTYAVGTMNLGTFTLPARTKYVLRRMYASIAVQANVPPQFIRAAGYVLLTDVSAGNAIGGVLDFVPAVGVTVTRNRGDALATDTIPFDGCAPLQGNEFRLFVSADINVNVGNSGRVVITLEFE